MQYYDITAGNPLMNYDTPPPTHYAPPWTPQRCDSPLSLPYSHTIQTHIISAASQLMCACTHMGVSCWNNHSTVQVYVHDPRWARIFHHQDQQYSSLTCLLNSLTQYQQWARSTMWQSLWRSRNSTRGNYWERLYMGVWVIKCPSVQEERNPLTCSQSSISSEMVRPTILLPPQLCVLLSCSPGLLIQSA